MYQFYEIMKGDMKWVKERKKKRNVQAEQKF